MSDIRSQISIQLAELVQALSQPFSSELVPEGWCERSWEKWGAIFRNMQETFTSGGSLPDASIARAMDFDGIFCGELLEKAASLSNLLRRFRHASSPDA
jgi:hypothetical protein